MNFISISMDEKKKKKNEECLGKQNYFMEDQVCRASWPCLLRRLKSFKQWPEEPVPFQVSAGHHKGIIPRKKHTLVLNSCA